MSVRSSAEDIVSLTNSVTKVQDLLIDKTCVSQEKLDAGREEVVRRSTANTKNPAIFFSPVSVRSSAE